MKLKQVDDEFAVADQITPSDIEELAEQGFKAVVCNRPDGEGPEQPSFAEIQAAAEAHGLEVRNVPVVSGQLTPADIAAFSGAMDEMPRPMLAYCRTGTRSIQLWALASGVKGMSGDDIQAAGKKAGYDLSPVVKWLQENQ